MDSLRGTGAEAPCARGKTKKAKLHERTEEPHTGKNRALHGGDPFRGDPQEAQVFPDPDIYQPPSAGDNSIRRQKAQRKHLPEHRHRIRQPQLPVFDRQGHEVGRLPPLGDPAVQGPGPDESTSSTRLSPACWSATAGVPSRGHPWETTSGASLSRPGR